jgi:uncharacterized membrane protein
MLDFLENAGLGKLERAIVYGVVLAVVLLIVADIGLARRGLVFDYGWITFLFRWLHVLSGVMWIGLLWYFNFVQIPSMPKIPDEQKPAVSKVIAPTALFWFRWAALATVITGLILAWLNGYIVQALTLGIGSGGGRPAAIGIGMWLGLIMAYNVWMIIWPNQQKALGLVDATPDEKKAAGRSAMLTSRFNTMFSVPMLYFMVAAQNIY